MTGPEPEAGGGAARKWWLTATVMVGCVATVLSATSVNVAMPDIMGEFGLGEDQVQWLSTAFLASMTATMLATDFALARFGTRNTYLAALAAFTLGSVLGGVSPGQEVLVLARVVQGAAAGMVQPLAMVVVFSAFGRDRRGLAMGVYGLGVVLAPALGPTVGGLLIDNFSWRYVFFLGVPFCAAGAALALAFLPPEKTRPAAFDFAGFALLCTAVAALLAGLSSGQREGWDAGQVTGAFAASAAAALAFLVRQRTAPTPLMDLSLYANPRFLAASAVALILGMGLYGSTYLVPLFVQTLQGYEPTDSGLLLMPAGIVLGLVMPPAGRLADVAPRHWLIAIGLAFFGWSSLCMTDAASSTDFWDFALWVALGRVGLGFILPSLNSGALLVLDAGQVAQGAGAINFMRQLGGAVGVSLLSIHLERATELHAQAFNALQTGTHAAMDAQDLISLILGRAGQFDVVTQALRPPAVYGFYQQMVAAQARVMGFRESFLLVALLFFAAMVPAWFMRRRRR